MEIGDRMKLYESVTSKQILIPNLPIIARIDGKAFHTWCKGLFRPYDERLQSIMDEVTKFLIGFSNAIVGYTQSDEVNLIIYNRERVDSSVLFDGRIPKLNSVLASAATAKFNQLVPKFIPEKQDNLAMFDCRVFNVPSKSEASNALLWRELDATRNAISMSAQSVYSHKQLFNKNSSELNEMLFAKGINFNDYPSRFRRGGYFRKKLIERPITEAELARIPEKLRNPETLVVRSRVDRLELPPLRKISNPVEVLFEGLEPKLRS